MLACKIWPLREPAEVSFEIKYVTFGCSADGEVLVDGKVFRGAGDVERGVAVNPEADDLPEAVPSLIAPVVFKPQREQSGTIF